MSAIRGLVLGLAMFVGVFAAVELVIGVTWRDLLELAVAACGVLLVALTKTDGRQS
jgi:hypothetical protein